MPSPCVWAQGCVASPNNPCSSALIPGEFTNTMTSRWSGSASYRWYQSDRMFVGDEEASIPAAINTVSLFDVSATYGFTHRWSATLTVPFIYADRSTVSEHTDGQRHTMHSGGLGDLRLMTDYWLLNPHKHMQGNIALGIGFKAPTGDDEETDISYRATGPVYRPVDQSIQPGDGGWGIILQLQAYQQIYETLYGYVQGSYLMAPKEQNGTQRVMGDFGAPNAMTFNSIPDQYFGRGGFSYFVWPKGGLTLSVGGRIEGVPVYDVIGDSLGFRVPGYTVSVEPGITWSGKKNSLSILAPVAVYRNRLRGAAEIALDRPGGPAGFADFSILASFTHRF